jgi:GPH family glycoside/pentoside/hexuronide:cation symporter
VGKETKAVPIWRTVFYSLGNAAGQLLYTTFNSFIFVFYSDHVGLPPDWVGRGLFGFGFWNAINDPIAGWLSDRTRTRWGRRRFYIGLLAIPTSIAFPLIWLPPFNLEDHGATALLVYFLVAISIYDMLQTIITLNQDALFPEMYHEMGSRAQGASIRQFIGFVVGNGVAVALTPTVYDSKWGWSGLAILWGTVSAIMYLVSLIGVDENPVFSQSQNDQLSWRDQMKLVFRNRAFIVVMCINFMTRFIVAALLQIMPFYSKYVLEISARNQSILWTSLFVMAGASLFFWQRVARRYGTRTSMLASFVISAISACFLLVTSGMVDTAIVLALLGLSVGGAILGPDLLFAEVIDEDFVKTRMRREGMYRGILGFIYRFPPALAGLILGEGLAYAHFDSDLKTAQPDTVVTVIRLFSAIMPMIAVVLGIGLLLIYPLYGEYLRDIQQRAETLRETMTQNQVS